MTQHKKVSKKQTTSPKKTTKKPQTETSRKDIATRAFLAVKNSLSYRRKDFLARRPHRSFRLTRRRDYVRSFKLPNYFMFTIEVWQMIWRNKLTLSLVGLSFFVLTIVFGLMGSQDNYQKFHDLLNQTAPSGVFEGVAGDVGKAGLLLFTAMTQGINNQPDPGQQIIALFLGLYVWLTIIWLLRNIMAGKKVKVRDGLYNAGAPIIPMALMTIVVLVQLIPIAIAVIVASAAWQSGFLAQGAWAMLASIGLFLLATLSMYWIVSTLIALIVVTLPGMYPMRALAIAGDLVVGRRLRLVYYFVWMFVVTISFWIVIMVPIILLDSWLKSMFEQIAWLPIVPVFLLMMSTFTIIWSATYTYLLYRKMVDDDDSPA